MLIIYILFVLAFCDLIFNEKNLYYIISYYIALKDKHEYVNNRES